MGHLTGNQELTHLVLTYGYWAILFGVTVDSFGVPLPGEAMLLSASVYAGVTHRLALPFLIGAAAAGAVCGDNLSFALGRQGGSRFLPRYGRFIRFDGRRQHLARYLVWRYGAPVVTIGRFIPVVHIWTAILAGANAMPWRRFVAFNAVGCILWAGLLGGAGYLLGRTALQLDGIVVALSVPLAIAIAGVTLLVLRALENRLLQAADQAIGLPGADVA